MGNTPSSLRDGSKSNGGLNRQSQVNKNTHQNPSNSLNPHALSSFSSTSTQRSSEVANAVVTAPSSSTARQRATHALRNSQLPPLKPVQIATAVGDSRMGNVHSRPLVTPLPTTPTHHTHASISSDPTSLTSTPTKKSEPTLRTDMDDTYVNASELYVPPRLPLPIESESYVPGSPVLSPDELKDDVDPLSGLAPVKNQSILSDKTLDEDGGDDLSTVTRGILPPVPTIIEYKEPGNKVYVTGTFADWDKKYRLYKGGPSSTIGALSTIIDLQPGVHHLRFIVDGNIVLSQHLPYTVDFTNSLVNYIEVVPKELPLANDPEAMIPAGLHTTAQQQNIQIRPTEENKSGSVHPPLTLPPTPRLAPTYGSPPPILTPDEQTGQQIQKLPILPPKKRYTSVIPQIFQDLDMGDHSESYRRACHVTETLPSPPSLPMMLNKSVLNQATPLKDDASVLAHPNHTQLNHLATSSIKNGVIATSATTRYKKKFLTSIVFKSAGLDD